MTKYIELIANKQAQLNAIECALTALETRKTWYLKYDDEKGEYTDEVIEGKGAQVEAICEVEEYLSKLLLVKKS